MEIFMKIGIAVSGTGGHIYPGLAIAELCLDKKNDEIVFFCNKKNLSIKILEENNNKKIRYDIIKLNIEGLKNTSITNLLKLFFNFFISFFNSIYYIHKLKIDVIVGLGGYLAFPVIIASKFLGKKIIIQEQNFYPGIANKILNIIADKTALGFEESKKYFLKKKQIFFTGNPIRKEFYNSIEKNIAKKKLNIPIEKKVIFIFGGSQGSSFLNNLSNLMHKIDNLKDIFIIHITGERDLDYKSVKNNYKRFKIDALVAKYMPNIYYAYFASDLIIARAGASSITEILITKKLAILIPYPFATNNHQLKNATFLQNLGIAKIYQEKNFEDEKDFFVSDINYFLKERNFENIAKSNMDVIKNYNNLALSFADNIYKLIIG
jgi:UDP-N-acetylglucosamine--N-acetylmuramyl-(pentapeptide) pyrophosphoryl-undecaprenol N-acetylglucosamine transferase